MDIAAITVLEKEPRRIARCLIDAGLSLEKIKRIIGCAVEELYPSTTCHYFFIFIGTFGRDTG